MYGMSEFFGEKMSIAQKNSIHGKVQMLFLFLIESPVKLNVCHPAVQALGPAFSDKPFFFFVDTI